MQFSEMNIKQFINDKHSYVFAPADMRHNGIYAQYVIYLNGQCLVIKPFTDNLPVVKLLDSDNQEIDSRGCELTRGEKFALRFRALSTKIKSKIMPTVMASYCAAEMAPHLIAKDENRICFCAKRAPVNNIKCLSSVYGGIINSKQLSKLEYMLIMRRLHDAFSRHQARIASTQQAQSR